MIRKNLLIILFFTGISTTLFTQNVAVTDDDAYTANASAMLDVKSTNKGFLAPRLTTAQRNAIGTPAAGLLVYDTTVGGYYYYNGSAWINLSSGSSSGIFWSYNSPNIYLTTSTDYLGLGTTAPQHKLHLYQTLATSDGTDGVFADIQNYSNTTGIMSGVRLGTGNSGTPDVFKGGIFFRRYGTYNRGDLILANNTNAASTNVTAGDARIILQNDGRVMVKGDPNTDINTAIFAVQNSDGDTIFAVYPEGVRVWVNDDGSKAAGSRGGFAVGGFSPSKAGFTNEYLRVTPDSVRVYIDETYVASKATGSRGGFAVGGFSPSKGITDNYLFVQDDSTRVYVVGDEGFAVDNIDAGNEARYLDMTPENYFIGHQSGQKTTPGVPTATNGIYNSFFGYQAGFSNTSGYNNLFMGYFAGYDNTSGYYNVFLGNSSGANNTDGFSNVFIGNNSGYNNTGGDYNVFLGNYSGQSNTSGTRNVMLGLNCGGLNSSGSYNTFLGTFAGYGTTTQSNNVILGNEAGRNNAGSNNIVMGYRAGYDNTGSNNVLLGYRAGYTTDSDNNTFVGTEAGYINSTGEKNVFLGYRAGYNNTTGAKNIVIGNNAGFSNTTGDNNICIGDTAGSHNTANNNIFIGAGAGRDNTSGTANIFMGSNAGLQNTTGTGNTYLGWAAASGNNGNNNVMIGYWAGLFASNSSQNTFIGQGAGLTNTGNDNIFMGYITGNSNGDNCIFIGNQLALAGDNRLCIDGMGDDVNPLIYGEFDNNFLRINGDAHIENEANAVAVKGLVIDTDGESTDVPFRVRTNVNATGYADATDTRLVVYGDGRVFMPDVYADNITGTYRDLYILDNGQLGYISSSLRYKENIHNLDNIDWVYQLRPVNYTYKNDVKKNLEYGLIAEEVDQINKTLVSYNEKGQVETVNYSKLVTPMLKALQDQKKEIDLLKKENSELKTKLGEIDKLKADIESLKELYNSSAKK